MADPTQNSNFTRMMQIIDEVFATRNDPSQLQVNEEVIEKLQKIHPVTIAEYNEGSGPCVWVLVIPTTTEILNLFLNGIITEQELFDRTLPGMNYEAVYLCSATALPEYRNKGLALRPASSQPSRTSAWSGDWPWGTPPPIRLSNRPGSVDLVNERWAIHSCAGRPSAPAT